MGYARVSTEEQTLDLQINALLRAGVPERAIHSEKVSAASSKRPGLALAIKHCREGDTLVVWKLDRVARSLRHLFRIVNELTDKGVGFRCLTQSFDTTTPAGKLMMAMLGAFAEFERDLIAERTRAGIERAQARGVKFGRDTVLTPEVRAEFERRVTAGEGIRKIAADMGIAESTFRKWYTAPLLAELRDSND